LLPAHHVSPVPARDFHSARLTAAKLLVIHKDTVNRLSPETACQVLLETLPSGDKPLQVYANEQTVAAVHGVSCPEPGSLLKPLFAGSRIRQALIIFNIDIRQRFVNPPTDGPPSLVQYF
jgi:hypothetical protein